MEYKGLQTLFNPIVRYFLFISILIFLVSFIYMHLRSGLFAIALNSTLRRWITYKSNTKASRLSSTRRRYFLFVSVLIFLISFTDIHLRSGLFAHRGAELIINATGRFQDVLQTVLRYFLSVSVVILFIYLYFIDRHLQSGSFLHRGVEWIINTTGRFQDVLQPVVICSLYCHLVNWFTGVLFLREPER